MKTALSLILLLALGGCAARDRTYWPPSWPDDYARTAQVDCLRGEYAACVPLVSEGFGRVLPR